MQFDRLELLMKQQGKTKKHMGEIVGKGGYYIKDCRTKGIQVPESIVRVWADDLNTTYEYLMGLNEPAQEPEIWVTTAGNAETGKSKLFDLPEISGIETDRQKMSQLLGMIAKKPSAKKDLDDVLTYLEFIAKRGE